MTPQTLKAMNDEVHICVITSLFPISKMNAWHIPADRYSRTVISRTRKHQEISIMNEPVY